MSLTYAEYGKDNVRVAKRDIDPASGEETFTEMTVCCLLSGAIEKSYTVADNSPIVATDSIKNTIYIKAKEHPVNPPELWASYLGQHFLDTYPHISDAHVTLLVHRWSRMTVDGKPHPHSFWRDGNDKHTVEVKASRGSGGQASTIQVKSGVVDLLVLKSTGSQFHGFVRDEFTTLPETWDRILSTSVTADWTWKPFATLADVEAKREAFGKAAADARSITFKLFAEQNSPSVQDTMHKMCLGILEAAPDVVKVEYVLPNKHYFEINLEWHKGIKNTGKDATVYAPQDSPNGLIKCAVTRS